MNQSRVFSTFQLSCFYRMSETVQKNRVMLIKKHHSPIQVVTVLFASFTGERHNLANAIDPLICQVNVLLVPLGPRQDSLKYLNRAVTHFKLDPGQF